MRPNDGKHIAKGKGIYREVESDIQDNDNHKLTEVNTTEKRCTDTNVRALESFNEYAALQCVFIANGEPPYADPHVRWCGRSENKSRKKTYFCFPPTRL